MAKSKLSVLDFYRKVPSDLTESSGFGAILSLCACFFMMLLFGAELYAFMNSEPEASLVLDPTIEKLRINFNVTMLELPCEYISVDLVDKLGTHSINITQNILKWHVDDKGHKTEFSGRYTSTKPEVQHEEHHDLEALIAENGKHVVVPSDTDDFHRLLKLNEWAFVAFVVPWCHFCTRLFPIWEAFAQETYKMGVPTPIVQVDCTKEVGLCRDLRVRAFPTLRLIKGDVTSNDNIDYHKDRTVEDFKDFLIRYTHWEPPAPAVQEEEEGEEVAVKLGDGSEISPDKLKPLQDKIMMKYGTLRGNAKPNEHIGCQVSGFVMVNRVPGNFHIEPRSHSHSFHASEMNMSHVVHDLSFGTRHWIGGEFLVGEKRQKAEDSVKFQSDLLRGSLNMAEETFIVEEPHQSFHHHTSVVSTVYERDVYDLYQRALHIGSGKEPPSKGRWKKEENVQYQMAIQSQLAKYGAEEIPEAKFVYDLSAVAVYVKASKKRWYDFLTSMCAIVGGTFTTVGLLNTLLLNVFKPKRA